MEDKYSDNFVQKKQERLIADRRLKPEFPREIFFDLSNICNHTCFFCSNSKISEYANTTQGAHFKAWMENMLHGAVFEKTV